MGGTNFDEMDDEDRETWNELYGPGNITKLPEYFYKTPKQKKKYFKKLKKDFLKKLKRNKHKPQGSKNVNFNLEKN